MSKKQEPAEKQQSNGREFLTIIIQVALVVFVLRTFFFQPFVIPSGSMRPTLLVGDYIFASKFSYGYSRYSFPFAPNLFSGRIWGAEPKRGDVVIFHHWNQAEQREVDYVKRLVGLPGDKIQMREGVLYINDNAVSRIKVGEITNKDVTEQTGPVDVYRETLPNGVSYNTLDLTPFGAVDNTREYNVPQGKYFMIGDNRDSSEDSRLSLGYVSYEELVGRARFIFFSIGNGASAWQIWRWPADARWNRIGRSVNTIQFFPPEKE